MKNLLSDNLDCINKEPKVFFGEATGKVSNLQIKKNEFEFTFGLNNQKITVINCEAPNWLKNDVTVTLNYQTKQIIFNSEKT